MNDHVRNLMSGTTGALVVTPVASFRWLRRNPDSGEHGPCDLVLQQAWIDNNGRVHWRDVPIVEGK